MHMTNKDRIVSFFFRRKEETATLQEIAKATGLSSNTANEVLHTNKHVFVHVRDTGKWKGMWAVRDDAMVPRELVRDADILMRAADAGSNLLQLARMKRGLVRGRVCRKPTIEPQTAVQPQQDEHEAHEPMSGTLIYDAIVHAIRQVDGANEKLRDAEYREGKILERLDELQKDFTNSVLERNKLMAQVKSLREIQAADTSALQAARTKIVELMNINSEGGGRE